MQICSTSIEVHKNSEYVARSRGCTNILWHCSVWNCYCSITPHPIYKPTYNKCVSGIAININIICIITSKRPATKINLQSSIVDDSLTRHIRYCFQIRLWHTWMLVYLCYGKSKWTSLCRLISIILIGKLAATGYQHMLRKKSLSQVLINHQMPDDQRFHV